MISVAKLKQKIRSIAEKENLPHEVLYQNFFFERFLERLSLSNHKDKIIIKGGYLITSLLGIPNRTTVDIDFTLNNLSISEMSIRNTINQIISVDLKDDCVFHITSISKIKHDAIYEGARVVILGDFNGLKFYFKVDLTTGDAITPSPVWRTFELNISNKYIELLSYNFETVLAEKLQTIIYRGIASTRAKDYFDVYSIIMNHRSSIDMSVLQRAFYSTMKQRNTDYSKNQIIDILSSIKESGDLRSLGEKYCNELTPTRNIDFDSVYLVIEEVISSLLL